MTEMIQETFRDEWRGVHLDGQREWLGRGKSADIVSEAAIVMRHIEGGGPGRTRTCDNTVMSGAF